MAISNTQRTLKYLRDNGAIVDVVERFNTFIGPHGKRHDCFGFGDILAISGNDIIMVQSTGQGFAEHDRTILGNEAAPKWLEAGGRIQLIAWRKIKEKRGGKRMIWSPRIKEYNLEHYDG